MAGATAGKRLAFASGLFILIVAACANPVGVTSDSQPSVSVPPPQMRLFTVSATPDVRSSTPPPTVAATPPTSLAELARTVYGDRLIKWITIPRIKVLSPVSPVGWQPVSDGNYGSTIEWDSPQAGVGWAVSSALPGDDANIILYGHNNLNASVFLRLGELVIGDEVELTTGEGEWIYQVATVNIYRAEDNDELDAAYQSSFAPGKSARLTIWSCWPPTGNTHRVIVVACPIGGCEE